MDGECGHAHPWAILIAVKGPARHEYTVLSVSVVGTIHEVTPDSWLLTPDVALTSTPPE